VRRPLLLPRVAIAAATAAAVGLLASSTACARRAGAGPSGAARATVRSIEDVFLLTGELRAVRADSLVAPRAEGELQIRWMAEDGAEVKQGERVAELDPTRLVQTIEERRLRLRQAEIDRESKERSAEAEREKKRVAVEKAQVEADKTRLDAEIPLEYRDPIDRPRIRAQWQQAKAALEKARLDREAHAVTSRADIAAARAALDKARREVEAAEKALGSMSLAAPRDGIFLVSVFWQWGPDGPRKLQPGDTVWPGYAIATIPDPSLMEVAASLAESDHGRISAGLEARCILDTYPDRVFAGRVEEVGSVAAEGGGAWFASASRSGFPVRVSLERTDALMRPGLSVRVEVVRGRYPRALVVPRAAVRFEKDGPVVGLSDGRTEKRVRLATCTPLDCVVASGLAEGEGVALP
jgi:multidrug efflux pump subunit AcrA (membrane-fusion protein)